ncbi:MAG TPA: hypothetical protein VF665_05555, partial [Longimicrobium sp.]|uniref:imidazolonepropionase-like domain-containing protein n=1 Tax=Longimicrobium sp. TaxID=2029185 RepID=UPI002EDB7930
MTAVTLRPRRAPHKDPRPRRAAAAVVGALWLALAAPAGAQAGAPDLVLVGGKVFTGVPSRPWAEAVAVRGERIVAVGTTAEVERLA